MTAAASGGGLGEAAVRGMAWTGIERLLSTAGRFAVGVVMARMLLPSDFGAVGILAIFLTLADAIADGGFATALIQRQDRTETDWTTAFRYNVAAALVMSGTLFAVAPAVAAFFRLSELTPIMRALAAMVALNGFAGIQFTRLTVELRFRALAFINLAYLAVSAAVGISIAACGGGPWAIVGQLTAGSLSNLLLAWTVSRWRPGASFSRESFRRLSSFGFRHVGASIANALYVDLYALVAGKAFGAAEIGHFNRAGNFAAVPADVVTGVVTKVNYPILSRLQDDPERLRHAFRRLLRVPMFLLVPALAGLAVVAGPLVRVLIGERWIPCVPLMQVLCAGTVFLPMAALNVSLLYVKGRTDLVLRLELIKRPIGFALLFGMLPFGLFWMCAGKALFEFIVYCVNSRHARAMTGYGILAQLRDVLPFAGYAAVMCAAMFAVMHAFALPFIQLIAAVAAGTTVYLFTAFICRDEALSELVAILRRRFRMFG